MGCSICFLTEVLSSFPLDSLNEPSCGPSSGVAPLSKAICKTSDEDCIWGLAVHTTQNDFMAAAVNPPAKPANNTEVRIEIDTWAKALGITRERGDPHDL